MNEQMIHRAMEINFAIMTSYWWGGAALGMAACSIYVLLRFDEPNMRHSATIHFLLALLMGTADVLVRYMGV